jgi:hypothetical protein
MAMTGEITLLGNVLPVGGIMEKLLAAHRAGIKRVIIPERNAKDLIDVPDQARREMEIISLKRMDELLGLALTELPEALRGVLETRGEPQQGTPSACRRPRPSPASRRPSSNTFLLARRDTCLRRETRWSHKSSRSLAPRRARRLLGRASMRAALLVTIMSPPPPAANRKTRPSRRCRRSSTAGGATTGRRTTTPPGSPSCPSAG